MLLRILCYGGVDLDVPVKIMNFLNNINITQKIILYILIINFFLGIPLYNELGLTNVDYRFILSEIFTIRWAGFWWGVNIVLLIGIYLFRDSED